MCIDDFVNEYDKSSGFENDKLYLKTLNEVMPCFQTKFRKSMNKSTCQAFLITG